jgi:hypothetical protein
VLASGPEGASIIAQSYFSVETEQMIAKMAENVAKWPKLSGE